MADEQSEHKAVAAVLASPEPFLAVDRRKALDFLRAALAVGVHAADPFLSWAHAILSGCCGRERWLLTMRTGATEKFVEKQLFFGGIAVP